MTSVAVGGLPRVSIGMPVYNGERYVGKAIESILAQTWTDFELLISDNASTDRTYEICRGYADSDPRIVLIRQATNLGAAGNFMQVFEPARGEYFKWACADDYCAPSLVASCVEVLDRNPEVVLCYGRTTLVDADGIPQGEYAEGLDSRSQTLEERIFRAREHHGMINVLQGVMRTGVLRDTKGFGSYHGSDTVLMLELALRGVFVELPQPLFFRRIFVAAGAETMSVADRQVHLDPKHSGRVPMVMLRLHLEKAAAILRSPFGWLTRLKLELGLLRSMYWHRRILLSELSSAFQRMVRARRVVRSA